MAVNQTLVDNLRAKVLTQLYSVTDTFVKRGNNGIKDAKLEKDVIRLYTLYQTLLIYDVTESYFDETFVLKIETEYDVLCGNNPSISINIACPTVEANPVAGQYDFTPSAVTVDEGSTGIVLSVSPSTLILVWIDAMFMYIGDGVKTKDIYFSDDGGTTAKEIKNIVLGDTLYYNAVITGTALLGTEEIRIVII